MSLNRDHRWTEASGLGVESRSARPAREWEVVRPRPERLAKGTLACPQCDLPIAAAATVAVGEGLGCPFCGRLAPARDYLRLGTNGPVGSRVAVIARY